MEILCLGRRWFQLVEEFFNWSRIRIKTRENVRASPSIRCWSAYDDWRSFSRVLFRASATLTRSDADTRARRNFAGRFLLSGLANKTRERTACPTGVVKPVPPARNEHSLLFTVHPASRWFHPTTCLLMPAIACTRRVNTTDLSYPANTLSISLGFFTRLADQCSSCFETLLAAAVQFHLLEPLRDRQTRGFAPSLLVLLVRLRFPRGEVMETHVHGSSDKPIETSIRFNLLI